jgi:NTP pyrophosphatase (non-canonical NTP hydrolase)
MTTDFLRSLRAQLNYSYPKTYKMNKRVIVEAHNIAFAKGFWDEDRPEAELLNLIRAELGEVLEAHRDGKIQPGQDVVLKAHGMVGTSVFADYYKQNLKGYVAEELADVCLRCFDLVASDQEKLDLFLVANKNFAPKKDFHLELQRAFWWASYASSKSKKLKPRVKLVVGLHGVVCAMQNLAKLMDIELDEHIELKMAYNKTRPIKHGRNY